MPAEVEIPDWSADLLDADHDIILTPHGRASGTTHAYARIILLAAIQRRMFAVILRQYKSSADDSLLALMRDLVHDYGIPAEAPPSSKSIRIPVTGSEIIVAGTERNTANLKGLLDRADVVMLEECGGGALTREQWRIIEPTIRKPGSVAILNWNPEFEDELAWELYQSPPPKTWSKFLTYRNNPWLPERTKRIIDHAHETGDEHTIAVFEGSFPPGGGVFRTSELRIGVRPADAIIDMQMRVWDLAATEGGGDYTCGALITIAGGRMYISDVTYGQWAPNRVQDTILGKCDADGQFVDVVIEEQPGAAGKIVQDEYNRHIVGRRNTRLTWVSTGGRSKLVRAIPASIALNNGLMSLDAHDTALTSQLSAFDGDKNNGYHDDFVDVIAMGYNTGRRFMEVHDD